MFEIYINIYAFALKVFRDHLFQLDELFSTKCFNQLTESWHSHTSKSSDTWSTLAFQENPFWSLHTPKSEILKKYIYSLLTGYGILQFFRLASCWGFWCWVQPPGCSQHRWYSKGIMLTVPQCCYPQAGCFVTLWSCGCCFTAWCWWHCVSTMLQLPAPNVATALTARAHLAARPCAAATCILLRSLRTFPMTHDASTWTTTSWPASLSMLFMIFHC